jgi:hypothetical protein
MKVCMNRESGNIPLLFKEGNLLARRFIHTFFDRPYSYNTGASRRAP